MKLILFCSVFVAQVAFAGQFVQKNMYSQFHLAIGTGITVKSAMRDAKRAIPTKTTEEYYEPDSDFNSPTYQCLNGVTWTEASECRGGLVQYAIPLRQVMR